MDYEEVTDRNVAQLDVVNRALGGHRQPPGSRADGGMLPHNSLKDLIQQIVQHDADTRNDLQDAQNMVHELEKDLAEVEKTVTRLKAELEHETRQREHFEGMLRQIATLVVNGTRGRAE